jgi:hypothetical protein
LEENFRTRRFEGTLELGVFENKKIIKDEDINYKTIADIKMTTNFKI